MLARLEHMDCMSSQCFYANEYCTTRFVHPLWPINVSIMCLQFVKELDASTSEVSELESKLSAAQRRIQKQAEEQEEAESARAQQGQQLNALAEDRQTLQSSLERVKQDRQQVCLCVLPCCTLCANSNIPQMLLLRLRWLCYLVNACLLTHRAARTADAMLGVDLHQLDVSRYALLCICCTQMHGCVIGI